MCEFLEVGMLWLVLNTHTHTNTHNHTACVMHRAPEAAAPHGQRIPLARVRPARIGTRAPNSKRARSWAHNCCRAPRCGPGVRGSPQSSDVVTALKDFALQVNASGSSGSGGTTNIILGERPMTATPRFFFPPSLYERPCDG